VRADSVLISDRAALLDGARSLLVRLSAAIRDAEERRQVAEGPTHAPERRTSRHFDPTGATRREFDEMRADLYAATARIVKAEHNVGEPPERVVTLIKSLLQGAGAARLSWPGGPTLSEDVVTHAIEAYYEP
jgi:hypothetical protein